MKSSFLEQKKIFNKKYNRITEITPIVSINGKYKNKVKILNKNKIKIEEYYKWQFIYSIIFSKMYNKEYLGTEVRFPKGNPSSYPIIIDCTIFDDKRWIDHYNNFWQEKKQSDLDWLRNHLIGVIEFKKEQRKNVEEYFNQQLKPAIKESEKDFVLGIYYDTETLWIFQKKNGRIIRYDESRNRKGINSTTKDLLLNIPDHYLLIPSFKELTSKKILPQIDKRKRKLEDLESISGIHTEQVNNAMSSILRSMDKVGLVNQRGYELLIQLLALKIFDEKECENYDSRYLKFFIKDKERNSNELQDKANQNFIKRIKKIYSNAKGKYYTILKNENRISWKDESHIATIKTIVENLQNFSFVKSYKTDLYQLVFYRFANQFAKEQKGQFITPIHLIDFLVNIVNPRAGEKVIDPTVGIADFLSLSYVNSNSKLDDNNLYGLDNDAQMIMLAQLNMLLNGDGNANLKTVSDKGSLTKKYDIKGNIVKLIPGYNKNGMWDNRPDDEEIQKFEVVLTNPPFGEDRKFEVKTENDKEIAEMYELWGINKQNNWIDPGLLFLENAVRLLKQGGRFGIVLSNSISSIKRWEDSREWLMDKVRIVALFDLPKNVFADTGVNITLIIGYKPEKKADLHRLKNSNYEIFTKDIKKVGYEVRTKKRIKYFKKLFKINEKTFKVETDEQGRPLLDEEFTETIKDFKKWAIGQEEKLVDLFIKEK